MLAASSAISYIPAVNRHSTRAPTDQSSAVVPSCARSIVIVSVLRPVTLTISMLPLASTKVAKVKSPASSIGNLTPVPASTVMNVSEAATLAAKRE